MADVSDSQQVNELVAKTKEAFGPINIAVSNVGIRHRMPFETISDEVGIGFCPPIYRPPSTSHVL